MSRFVQKSPTPPFLPSLRPSEPSGRFARAVDVRPMRFLLPEVDWRERGGPLPEGLRGRSLSSVRRWRGRVERQDAETGAWVVWVAEVPSGRSYEVELPGVSLRLGQSLELWTAFEHGSAGWCEIEPVVIPL